MASAGTQRPFSIFSSLLCGLTVSTCRSAALVLCICGLIFQLLVGFEKRGAGSCLLDYAMGFFFFSRKFAGICNEVFLFVIDAFAYFLTPISPCRLRQFLSCLVCFIGVKKADPPSIRTNLSFWQASPSTGFPPSSPSTMRVLRLRVD